MDFVDSLVTFFDKPLNCFGVLMHFVFNCAHDPIKKLKRDKIIICDLNIFDIFVRKLFSLFSQVSQLDFIQALEDAFLVVFP